MASKALANRGAKIAWLRRDGSHRVGRHRSDTRRLETRVVAWPVSLPSIGPVADEPTQAPRRRPKPRIRRGRIQLVAA